MRVPDLAKVVFASVLLVAPATAKEEASFRYITFRADSGQPEVQIITADRWKGWRPGARLDYLRKFWSATTRGASRRNIGHAACFTGVAQEIRDSFFTQGDPNVVLGQAGAVSVTASQDGVMLGIQFASRLKNEPKREYHFRMVHCEQSGKAPVYGEGGQEVARAVQSGAFSPPPVVTADRETPFSMNDRVEKGRMPPGLKPFVLKADYEAAAQVSETLPWKGKTFNLRDAADAQALAVMLQKYFYEGMTPVGAPNDKMFIAQNNRATYWCHMPWQQLGESGREAIHGLTAERNLFRSDVYPVAPVDSRSALGSDWGVGYYNSIGCRTIGDVFGSRRNPRPAPDWTRAVPYGDGTISVKILFTTATFDAVKNAFAWQANVYKPEEKPRRSVQTVRHIQMDIGVKASELNPNPFTNNWLMLTYYYDESYTNDLGIPGLPAGLTHMRPVGVQFGYSQAETVLLPGAKTNQQNGLLNGPADNPKSSCLSCHAQAGMPQDQVPMAPGITSNEQWETFRSTSLDFSQQMRLAKDNFETTRK
jgi:hypothetical protein